MFNFSLGIHTHCKKGKQMRVGQNHTSRETTIYMLIYGVYIRFWSTLSIRQQRHLWQLHDSILSSGLQWKREALFVREASLEGLTIGSQTHTMTESSTIGSQVAGSAIGSQTYSDRGFYFRFTNIQ